MNTLGENFVFTSFGESHGRTIGAEQARRKEAYPHPLPEGKGEDKKIVGRHDACIAVRAAAVVKAMAALVVEDFLSK